MKSLVDVRHCLDVWGLVGFTLSLSTVTRHSWERRETCAFRSYTFVSQPLFLSCLPSVPCVLCNHDYHSTDKHTRLKPKLDPQLYLPAVCWGVIVSCFPRDTWVKRLIYAAFRKYNYVSLLQHKEQFPSSRWLSRRLEVQTWDQSSVRSSSTLLRHLEPRQPSAGTSSHLHRQNK